MATISTCRYFQQNNCTRGDACQFRHDPSSTVASSPIPCQYFLRGSCQFGTNCRNVHICSARTTKTCAAEVRPCTFFMKNACSKGSSCPFSHDVSLDKGIRFEKVQVTEENRQPFGACKFFLQGRCTKGVGCPFPHEPTSSLKVVTSGSVSPFPSYQKAVPIVKPTPQNNPGSAEATPTAAESLSVQESQPSTTERHVLGANVTFGLGASVELVTTTFESSRVNLCNLPIDVSQADIITLVEPFGYLKNIIIHKASTATALIEFRDPKEAERAVAELNIMELRSFKLVARLALHAGESGMAVLRSCKVKLSWYAPSFVAWAYYPFIFSAREAAERLDGRLFGGRKIKATFQTPHLRQNKSFSVEIKGLSPLVHRDSFRTFCGADSITLGGHSFHEEQAFREMRQVLEAFGHLEAFDVPPGDETGKIKAFAQFSSSEAAAKAVKSLHNKPQDFLARGPLFMEIVHSVKYDVLAQHFKVLQKDIDELCAQMTECKIRYYTCNGDGSPVDPVCVRVHTTEPKCLGRAKAKLEQLLSGEIFTLEGIEIWDDFFDTKAAKLFFDAVLTDNHVFVSCDRRKRCLKLSGDEPHKSLARKKILEKLQEIRAQRHDLPLDIPTVRRLMTGGLAELNNALGASRISLDVVARQLTIHGGEDIVRKAKRALAELNHSPDTIYPSSAADCPVCFCEAADDSTALPCGHSYCTSCLEHLLKSIPDTKTFPIRCVAEVEGSQCSCIPLSVIREIMSPGDEEKVLEASFLSHIHKQPNAYRYCPTPDCQIVYRPGSQGTVLRCPSCLVRICPSCHVEFHEGLTCAEHQDNISGGQEAYRKWRLANNVKPCPNCGADLQKNGGCNHITCLRCQTHICWACMQTFAASGIYTHMNTAHGGIGII